MEFDKRSMIEKLKQLRHHSGAAFTKGLDDDVIESFLKKDDSLAEAIEAGHAAFENLEPAEKAMLEMDERELCRSVQKRYVNFYPQDGINHYIPLGASGPWIVTTHGAVIHDSGGYGMLGIGHAPEELLEALAHPWVMANVMTPSLSQKRFSDRLVAEIGHSRGGCPFDRFLCLNSGSEAVSITARIADIHAKSQTDPGARYDGRAVRTLAVDGGFHGRTSMPARLSQSTREAYEDNLASFRKADEVVFVDVNNSDELEKTFAKAKENKVFFSAFYIEPVMGEGVPGMAITREFYDTARRLTKEHGALLVVDSIQAALRAQGTLSIVDYPGFEDSEAPDMETYSKALNAGQFPLSVVALTSSAAEIYVTGVYGNTMTTNPRALEIGAAVLDTIDDELRCNIRDRGAELLEKLSGLAADHVGIERVDGTGLMVCVQLEPEIYTVNGAGGFEEFMRCEGIEMIHGGENGLRFTPHFNITSEEIDLIVSVVRRGLEKLARRVS